VLGALTLDKEVYMLSEWDSQSWNRRESQDISVAMLVARDVYTPGQSVGFTDMDNKVGSSFALPNLTIDYRSCADTSNPPAQVSTWKEDSQERIAARRTIDITFAADGKTAMEKRVAGGPSDDWSIQKTEYESDGKTPSSVIRYDNRGRKSEEFEYKDGKLKTHYDNKASGFWREKTDFHADGKTPAQVTTYDDAGREARSSAYRANGTLEFTTVYEAGKRTLAKVFGPDGKTVTEELRFRDGMNR
jgi:antitoxin component YwqK of YwqJK toxin-antitoxin module